MSRHNIYADVTQTTFDTPLVKLGRLFAGGLYLNFPQSVFSLHLPNTDYCCYELLSEARDEPPAEKPDALPPENSSV